MLSAMGDFWVCVLLINALLRQNSGYIFRVKSESSGKGVCLTDEKFSAVAPIQLLDSALRTSFENGWLASVSRNENECIPNVHCKNWKLNHTGFKPNFVFLAEETGFLKNWRWNYFPEFKTNTKDVFNSPAIFLSEWLGVVQFSVSILAEEAQILLTGGAQWPGQPGLVINLGSSGLDFITTCPTIRKDFNALNNAPGCNSTRIGGSTNYLRNGSRWVHLKLGARKSPNHSYKLEFLFDGRTEQIVNVKCKVGINLNYISFGSKRKPALFKLHKYEVLSLKQNDPLVFEPSAMEPFKIAFTFKPNQTMKNIAAIKNSLKVSGTSNLKDGWRTEHFQIDRPTPEISFVPEEDLYLAGIGFSSKEIHAYYFEGDLKACQILETDEITSITPSDNVEADFIPKFDFAEICGKLNATRCFGVEACSPGGCFCFSGYTRSFFGKCTKKCEKNHFGPNCLHKLIGECKSGKYHLHTGCLQCEKTLRPPDCFQSVSVFRAAPEIVDVGMTYAYVSIRKALSKVNQDDEQHFMRGELQLLQDGAIKDKAQFFDLKSSPLVKFTHLSRYSSYTVRLVFFEAGNLHDLGKSPEVHFHYTNYTILSIYILLLLILSTLLGVLL